MKTTLIIGASTNPDRYSFKAANLLTKFGHPVLLYGLRSGTVGDNQIIVTKEIPNKLIDTITLYVNPFNQTDWIDFILKVKPHRVIFNPGTENPELYMLLSQNNIAYEEACTLVLLNTNQY